jgi:hypothetical protein
VNAERQESQRRIVAMKRREEQLVQQVRKLVLDVAALKKRLLRSLKCNEFDDGDSSSSSSRVATSFGLLTVRCQPPSTCVADSCASNDDDIESCRRIIDMLRQENARLQSHFINKD